MYGGFIAYGVYFNRKCKGFGYSQQCQREIYFEPYGISGKNIGQDSGRGRFFHQCAAVMQDMRMEGVSSAYGYLVDSDGTMLYHPTADKIGKSVENEVVKGVVSQLQSGNIPQDAVVTYNFNGTVKYAAYALTSDHKIVVMSADKGEIMEPITNMVRLMQITMGVCLIICCLAALVLTNMITKPIHQLTYIITRTANFDFTHNANSRRLYSRKDEIGIMAAEMHIMRKICVIWLPVSRMQDRRSMRMCLS